MSGELEIFQLLHHYGLQLNDLYEIGGEDLRSSQARERERARRAEQMWAAIAKLELTWEDLEEFASQPFNRSLIENIQLNQRLRKSRSKSKNKAISST